MSPDLRTALSAARLIELETAEHERDILRSQTLDLALLVGLLIRRMRAARAGQGMAAGDDALEQQCIDYLRRKGLTSPPRADCGEAGHDEGKCGNAACCDMLAAPARALSQPAAARVPLTDTKDAARYRWLRDRAGDRLDQVQISVPMNAPRDGYTSEEMDAAIDADMAAAGQEGEGEANAAPIAAAPELLRALQAITNDRGTWNLMSMQLRDLASAAIAKATIKKDSEA